MTMPADGTPVRDPGYASVKFDKIGRARTFLLPEVDFETSLEPGDDVIVTLGEARAFGTVTRSIPEISTRRASGGAPPEHVVRKATADDVAVRFKNSHREREAMRIGGMKIHEHGASDEARAGRAAVRCDPAGLLFHGGRPGRFSGPGSGAGNAVPLPDRDASDRGA